MADVQATVQRVTGVAQTFRAMAGTILSEAQKKHHDGALDDAGLAQVKEAYNRTLAQASDMLVDLDDALAASLDVPLSRIEQATKQLEQSQATIAKAAMLVNVALKVVEAATAVALLVGAPTPAGVAAAVSAIGDVISAASPPAG